MDLSCLELCMVGRKVDEENSVVNVDIGDLALDILVPGFTLKPDITVNVANIASRGCGSFAVGLTSFVYRIGKLCTTTFYVHIQYRLGCLKIASEKSCPYFHLLLYKSSTSPK